MDIFLAISALLRHTASTVVMPRYADLASAGVRMKAPGEPVTIADCEAEAIIGSALLDLLPGSRVIGEEACSRDPNLIGELTHGQVWLIDPIDGTANFAAGRPPFAMMIALLNEGETVASWILDPVTDTIAIAERGSGAWINGNRVLASTSTPTLSHLQGIISRAFCPPYALPCVQRLSARVSRVFNTARCAGHEYPLVATQRRDFAIYWRTLAWDHAPGALLLEEAGGSVLHLDGSKYRPGLARTGLLLAINEQVAANILLALGQPRRLE